MDKYINKVIQGDCLEIMKGMPDKSVDLVLTSPPYNFGGFSRNGRKRNYDIYEDSLETEDYKKWIESVLIECARILKDGGVLYWNHKGKFVDGEFQHTFWIIDKCPLKLAQHITWEFPASPDVAKIKWYPRKEDIYYFTKGKPNYFNEDMARLTDIWRINHQQNNSHPAPFPLELAKRCINASTQETDIILDPFMGSGTTLVAAKQLGRNAVGIEISEKYCEIARNRLSQDLLF